ncbi:MAG: tryptophan-rich sensory protein [Caulobacteraceae bacterium]|nr:tryptophan-rich sensory protein [Caulobacteraceae bacterium]
MHARYRETVDGRNPALGQVAAGLALTAVAVLISAMIAGPGGGRVDGEYDPARPAFQPPKPVFGLAWPPLFIALTLSGLRLWNAPASRARTRALTLWTVIQGLNALWMALGPRRLGGRLTAAVAAVGTAAAYAVEARKVDAPAGSLAGPYIGWIGLANVLTEHLWRGRSSATK